MTMIEALKIARHPYDVTYTRLVEAVRMLGGTARLPDKFCIHGMNTAYQCPSCVGVEIPGMARRECNCQVCDRWKRFIALFPAVTEQQHAMHSEIFTDLEGAETDAVYWRMKFQGTWDRPICQRAPLAVSETGAEHG